MDSRIPQFHNRAPDREVKFAMTLEGTEEVQAGLRAIGREAKAIGLPEVRNLIRVWTGVGLMLWVMLPMLGGLIVLAASALQNLSGQ